MTCNLLFIQFGGGFIVYFQVFFHGSSAICFTVSNETIITPSAQGQNFKITCMIMASYASNDLIHIHIYKLVVIYLEKNPCW
jgi:hypothetical protein